eukprot:2074930-Amphidinium_carterae.1
MEGRRHEQNLRILSQLRQVQLSGMPEAVALPSRLATCDFLCNLLYERNVTLNVPTAPCAHRFGQFSRT